MRNAKLLWGLVNFETNEYEEKDIFKHATVNQIDRIKKELKALRSILLTEKQQEEFRKLVLRD